MRVALIVPGGFDRGDRVMTALLNLAAELAQRHAVEVFAADGPGGSGRYEREGATVHQLGGGAQSSLRARGNEGAWHRGRVVARLVAEMAHARSEGPFH